MKEDEKLIQKIITRYGEIINLKETPYLILEIIRTHGGKVSDVPDGGVSVAGVGTPPGPAQSGFNPVGNVVDNAAIMKEVLKLSKKVSKLSDQLKDLSKGK